MPTNNLSVYFCNPFAFPISIEWRHGYGMDFTFDRFSSWFFFCFAFWLIYRTYAMSKTIFDNFVSSTSCPNSSLFARKINGTLSNGGRGRKSCMLYYFYSRFFQLFYGLRSRRWCTMCMGSGHPIVFNTLRKGKEWKLKWILFLSVLSCISHSTVCFFIHFTLLNFEKMANEIEKAKITTWTCCNKYGWTEWKTNWNTLDWMKWS